MRRTGFTVALAVAATMTLVVPVAAKAPYVKKAKDLGHADLVKNCASCHSKPMPKLKDAELNDLGKWLVEQKTAKNAKEIDLGWLKEYKPLAVGK
jgi:hypothetical protein